MKTDFDIVDQALQLALVGVEDNPEYTAEFQAARAALARLNTERSQALTLIATHHCPMGDGD